MRTFTLESMHFIFTKCAIYTHDGASAKFSTNSQETDYSAGFLTKISYLYLFLSASFLLATSSLFCSILLLNK
jgi:hypothetical protein